MWQNCQKVSSSDVENVKTNEGCCVLQSLLSYEDCVVTGCVGSISLSEVISSELFVVLQS